MRQFILYSVIAAFGLSCGNVAQEPEVVESALQPIFVVESSDGEPQLAFGYSLHQGWFLAWQPSPERDPFPQALWGDIVRDLRRWSRDLGPIRFSASSGGVTRFNASLTGGLSRAITPANTTFSAQTPANVSFDPSLGLGLGRACNLRALCDYAALTCDDEDCDGLDVQECYTAIYAGGVPDDISPFACIIADFVDCSLARGEDGFRECVAYLEYYSIDFNEPGRPDFVE